MTPYRPVASLRAASWGLSLVDLPPAGGSKRDCFSVISVIWQWISEWRWMNFLCPSLLKPDSDGSRCHPDPNILINRSFRSHSSKHESHLLHWLLKNRWTFPLNPSYVLTIKAERSHVAFVYHLELSTDLFKILIRKGCPYFEYSSPNLHSACCSFIFHC